MYIRREPTVWDRFDEVAKERRDIMESAAAERRRTDDRYAKTIAAEYERLVAAGREDDADALFDATAPE